MSLNFIVRHSGGLRHSSSWEREVAVMWPPVSLSWKTSTNLLVTVLFFIMEGEQSEKGSFDIFDFMFDSAAMLEHEV